VSRSAGRGPVVLAAGLAVGVAAFTVWTAVHQRLVDLQVYRFGGATLRAGGDLYAGGVPGSGLPFTYPPFAAVVFAPLSALPWRAAVALLTVTGLVCLLAVLRMVCGRAVPTVGSWAVPLVATSMVVFSEPVRETLRLGQVNLVLGALVVGDVWLARRWWRGGGVGIAAGTKLTPVLTGAYLIAGAGDGTAGGRVRAARGVVAAVAGFAATVAVGVLAAPSSSREYWLGGVGLDADRVGGTAYIGNQSLSGFVIRLAGDPAALPALRIVVGVLVLVLGLVVAAMFLRAGRRELPALASVLLAGWLASPISWTHHWVLWPVAAAGVWRAGGRSTGRAAVAVGFTAVMLIGPIWFVPHGSDHELHRTFAQAVVGEAYVEVGVLALGVLTGAALVLNRSRLNRSGLNRSGLNRWGLNRSGQRVTG